MVAFAFIFSVFGALTATADADAFLGASVSKEAIEQALLLELPGSENSARLTAIEEELRSMYDSLPKSDQGQLEPSTVRYALHRYFVHKHGWYVKGLDPQGAGVGTNTSSTEVMKDLAPAYIQKLFEQRLHGRGLQLQELAVFVATVSDLIFLEGAGSLREVYQKMDMPIDGPVSEKAFDEAIRAYFAGLVNGVWVDFHSARDFPTMEQEARDRYAEYDDVIMWARDLRKSQEFFDQTRRNPFVVDNGITWERATAHLQELMHHFGALTRNECRSLKEDLLQMAAPGTGRVLLSDFYANTNLQLRESVAYLRNLGVLEEEGLRNPRVIMSNYITSVSRCMPFSSYFSVCCSDECESLTGSLENAIRAPHAAPSRIAEVVSGLSSDTKSAPWSISPLLMDRLNEIASHHHGQVPLHGRLFMQWMHHAYPQECPFPHVSGTTSPVSQDEWLEMHQNIETVEAHHNEKDMHSSRRNPEVHAGLDDLPWAAVEELVAIDKPSHSSRKSKSLMRNIAALVALVSFAMPLAHASKTLLGCGPKEKTHHLV